MPRKGKKKASAAFIGPLPQGVKRRTKRKSKAKTQNNPAPQRSIVKHAHVQHACSITDPFCPAARAAKRPDGLGSSSIGFSVRGHKRITTDATGSAMICLVPGIGRYGANFPALSGGTWTFQSTWGSLPGSEFINSNASEVRIVSAGAIFRSTASATDCKGVVNMFVLPNPVISGTIAELSSNYPETQMLSMTSGLELSWISKPIGSKAHAFRPYSEAVNNMSDFDWTSLVIEVSGGAASTTIAVVEYVYNVEFTLSNTSIGTTALAGSITKPRPSNPVALSIQNKAHTSMSSFVTGGVEKLEKAVSTAASDAFDMMGTFGLGLLGF